MARYPALSAALDGFDLDEFAAACGVPADVLRAVLTGHVAAFSVRDRCARILGANPVDLFRLDDDLEQALDAAPTRYVSDPATCRVVDRPRVA
jgi:hypothetical protein